MATAAKKSILGALKKEHEAQLKYERMAEERHAKADGILGLTRGMSHDFNMETNTLTIDMAKRALKTDLIGNFNVILRNGNFLGSIDIGDHNIKLGKEAKIIGTKTSAVSVRAANLFLDQWAVVKSRGKGTINVDLKGNLNGVGILSGEGVTVTCEEVKCNAAEGGISLQAVTANIEHIKPAWEKSERPTQILCHSLKFEEISLSRHCSDKRGSASRDALIIVSKGDVIGKPLDDNYPHNKGIDCGTIIAGGNVITGGGISSSKKKDAPLVIAKGKVETEYDCERGESKIFSGGNVNFYISSLGENESRDKKYWESRQNIPSKDIEKKQKAALERLGVDASCLNYG